jgi:hypothetical protein
MNVYKIVTNSIELISYMNTTYQSFRFVSFNNLVKRYLKHLFHLFQLKREALILLLFVSTDFSCIKSYIKVNLITCCKTELWSIASKL